MSNFSLLSLFSLLLCFVILNFFEYANGCSIMEPTEDYISSVSLTDDPKIVLLTVQQVIASDTDPSVEYGGRMCVLYSLELKQSTEKVACDSVTTYPYMSPTQQDVSIVSVDIHPTDNTLSIVTYEFENTQYEFEIDGTLVNSLNVKYYWSLSDKNSLYLFTAYSNMYNGFSFVSVNFKNGFGDPTCISTGVTSTLDNFNGFVDTFSLTMKQTNVYAALELVELPAGCCLCVGTFMNRYEFGNNGKLIDDVSTVTFKDLKIDDRSFLGYYSFWGSSSFSTFDISLGQTTFKSETYDYDSRFDFINECCVGKVSNNDQTCLSLNENTCDGNSECEWCSFDDGCTNTDRCVM